jgi:hypothetical protein
MLPQHSDIEIAWYASIQQEPNGWKTVTTQFYIQEFSEYIAPLQDAVDLEIATEEERSLLEAWNKYRVLLNRVDTSVALGMKLFVTHVTVTVITISRCKMYIDLIFYKFTSNLARQLLIKVISVFGEKRTVYMRRFHTIITKI